MTLTKTTTTNKMPTTAVNAGANDNAQKKQPKMIAKWSGSDEPQSYYDHEDTDTATLTRHEANYIRWYHSIDHSNWRNADDEYEECTHVPFMNLTKEQRAEKSKNFKFGLCCDCDAGLDDKSDFVRETRLSGDVKMCNACNNYHMDVFEMRVGGEHGGCN